MRTLLVALLLLVPVGLALVAVAVVRAEAPVVDAAAGVVLGAAVVGGVAWVYVRRRVDTVADAAAAIAAGEDADAAIPAAADPRLGSAVTALAVALGDARRDATVDRLTGVSTRASVIATLTSEVERAIRYDRQLSVAFIDVDHFKAVNDSHGHVMGDSVLRAVAQAIRSALRTTDVVGRYGGEEFVVVLPETSIDDAATISEKLRSAVEKASVRSRDGTPVSVTISVGITGGRGRTLRAEVLLRGADAAMYAAKALGRNQVAVDAALDELSLVAAAPISAAEVAQAREIGARARRAAEVELVEFVHGLPEGGGRPSDAILSIADALARSCGMTPPEVERVRLAAILRDVGKVTVPAEVLQREGPLTGAEWQLIAQHPRIGQVILEQSAALREVAPLVLYHHERWGGHGYPYGLRGTEIPLGARIIAIADTYDAIVVPRAGHRRAAHDEAFAEILRRSGTQFDPDLVAMFRELFATGVPPRSPEWSVDALGRSGGGPARAEAVPVTASPDMHAGDTGSGDPIDPSGAGPASGGPIA
jgi:diguanylate cyclase (GGDEF)-like protein